MAGLSLNPADLSSFSNGTQFDLSIGTEGGDLLGTPGGDSRRSIDVPETPTTSKSARASRSATGTKGTTTLTLRDQEKHIDNLKKENFNIKLRVHFLEERLRSLAPEQMDAALKQNINLKIEVQQRGMEIKKLKKLVLELERELDRLQRGAGGSRNRERELEEKLEERERELNEMRRRRSGDHDGALREVEARNAELEEELENARGLLEENMDEIERLKEIVEKKGDMSMEGDSKRDKAKRRMEELEMELQDLHAQLEEDKEIIAQKDDEKEDLLDVVNTLRLEIEDLQRRRQAESIERSESRAQIMEEREEREAVEEDLAALRDKLAALMIELQQKEDEVEMKNREIDELVEEHKRIVSVVDDEWKGEVEEARGRVDELKDLLAERESESKELRDQIDELELNQNDVHHKFEAAIAHLEEEAENKDAEIASLNAAVERVSEQLYVVEDKHDQIQEEFAQKEEAYVAERDKMHALTNALKEKVASLNAELQDMADQYEATASEIHAHRTRQEELARHIEELVHENERERQARENLETEFANSEKRHDKELRNERRTLEAKESALQSALADLTRTQSLLTQREADMQALQNALNSLETESKKLGESHTTARFSLQLETDRLKRDLERVEDELARARQALSDQDAKFRDRDGALDKLHADNRDLTSQLAAQTQARLNLSEKLDGVQASLKAAEGEAASFKAKVTELEQRLSKDQRSLLSAETQYRDQLTERNTLLLTVYQYLDKILGVDKTPKKSGQAETKPFTNFTVFHDNLITRLKQLLKISADFEKRCKDAETRFTEKIADMRKQLDNRWKQIDKFEASVKQYADAKTAWRRKLASKDGELEAIRTTNTEMAAQLASIKRGPGSSSDAMEIRSLATRAANAERRLNNAQNQLLATEEKVAQMNQKSAAADTKWEARVKEYESRLKAAEERVKRERQGSKERVAELEANLKSIQRQLELAQKRNQQLSELVDINKTTMPGTPGSQTPR